MAGGGGDSGNATDYQLAQQGFVREGVDRALALGNRGPLKFNEDGGLHEEIIDAYWRSGFYVFENVVDPKVISKIVLSGAGLCKKKQYKERTPID